MAANFCVLIVLLIYSYHVYEVSTAAQNPSGIRGGTTPTLFSSAGGPVTLPCENVLYQNCSSTTWIYSAGSSGTVEVVGHGQVRKDSPTKRTERFRVESDCSLHMTNVTAEDAGLYTCQQFPEEGGADAPVYLTVLQVYASGGVTQIEAGSDVTLYCLLQTHDRCGRTVENKGVHLTWVDNGGMELRSTNSRVIRSTSACNITVTETVLDLNPFEKERWWTCQLTADGRVQASATYTIPRPPVITICMIVKVPVFCSLLAAVVITTVVVYKRRRANSERGT